MKQTFVLLILVCTFSMFAQIGTPIQLYDSYNMDEASEPILYANLVDVEKGEFKPAILIFPGGGYAMLSLEHEGSKVAEWFNERGVHAFILKYRTGEFDGSGSKHPDMLNDAKRAMRILRANAKKWKIDTHNIGVIGFSAGGHLATSLSTHFDSGNPKADVEYEKYSCLPNFCVLGYPVVSLKNNAHWGSRRFLLGPTPSQEDVDFLSNENHVKAITPPTFIFSTSDDKSVPVQNSVDYYLACKEKGIPVELHIFQHGVHGVGLAQNDEVLSEWNRLLEHWLKGWSVIDKSFKRKTNEDNE